MSLSVCVPVFACTLESRGLLSMELEESGQDMAGSDMIRSDIIRGIILISLALTC